MSNLTIYVDMDGVIADCNKHAAVAYGIPYDPAGDHYWGWVTDKYNELHPDKPVGHGDFTRITNTVPGFWATVPFYPWAKDLVDALDNRVCVNWRFLTKCVDHAHCPAGKFASLVRHFGLPTAKKAIMIWDRKHDCCKPGDLLIDDDERNRAPWRAAGGFAYNWKPIGPAHPEGFLQAQDCIRWCLENIK